MLYIYIYISTYIFTLFFVGGGVLEQLVAMGSE